MSWHTGEVYQEDVPAMGAGLERWIERRGGCKDSQELFFVWD